MYNYFQFSQPNLTNVQSANSHVSLPAMSASFDTIVSRAVKVTSKEKIEKPPTEDTFNIDSYTEKDEKDKQLVETQKKNLFELLKTESKPVINFSDCKLKNDYTIYESTKNIGEPVTKKRKIKMLPTEVNEHLSVPSTSCVKREHADNTKYFQQIFEETNNDTDKKALGKAYLKEVNM